MVCALGIAVLQKVECSCTTRIAAISPFPTFLYRSRHTHTLAPLLPTKSRANRLQYNTSLRATQIALHFSEQDSPAIMSSLPISERGFHSNAPSSYTVRKLGAPNTLEHRIYIEKDGIPVSPFHDIPLYANEQQTVLNMVVEIPRWTNAKVEVSRNLSSLLLSRPTC